MQIGFRVQGAGLQYALAEDFFADKRSVEVHVATRVTVCVAVELIKV